MRLTKEQKEQINNIKYEMLQLQNKQNSLYLCAQLILNTHDKNNILKNYLHNSELRITSLSKLINE
jgi:hypothetical protein